MATKWILIKTTRGATWHLSSGFLLDRGYKFCAQYTGPFETVARTDEQPTTHNTCKACAAYDAETQAIGRIR